jgi:hypothetical protein
MVGYTAIELFDHLLDQYVQPEDLADQITALHKILEQTYDLAEEPRSLITARSAAMCVHLLHDFLVNVYNNCYCCCVWICCNFL